MNNASRQPLAEAISRLPVDRLVEALRERIAAVEGARREAASGLSASASSGCEPLDRLLPGPGFRRGTLAEWLSADAASGAGTLTLLAAREAALQGGAVVVLDLGREFYPPAAVRLGIEPEKLIVVQPASQSEGNWALDQALRCRAVAAAVAWPASLDGHTFRRLQLASEEGGSLGLLIRPAAARAEPSWADVRLWVEPLPALSESAGAPRRVKIEVLRSRGTAAGRSLFLEIDDEAHIVHLDPRMADPAARARAARA